MDGLLPQVINISFTYLSILGGLELGAWVLGALLYIWQIPHFHSLAWRLQSDYKKGGYKMLCTVSPEKVPRVALLWSTFLLPLGALCAATGMTSWIFAIDSLIPNLYLLYHAHNFYQDNSNMKARKLFFATLSYLPAFLVQQFPFTYLTLIGSHDASQNK